MQLLRPARALARTVFLLSLFVAVPVSAQVVISQAYGGGGNSGATYTHDFVELFNRGSTPADLDGWSIQYASATGSSWTNKVDLPAQMLQPGQYFLIQLAQGNGGSTPLPTPDAVGAIAMSGTNFKLALVSSTAPEAGTCPAGPQILDFLGIGSANCHEGTDTAPVLSNSTAALRADAGCTDTDDNSADFTATAPAPRNSATALAPCAGPPNGALSVADVAQAEGNAGTSVMTFTVSLSGGDASGSAFDVDFAVQETAPASATAGSDFIAAVGTLNFTNAAAVESRTIEVVINGDTVPEGDEAFEVVLSNATGGVTIQDGSATGTILNDDLAELHVFELQGPGAFSPLVGSCSTDASISGPVVLTAPSVVTGIGADGFSMQTPDAEADADPLTSNGVFVFTASVPAVALGDLVRVQGTIMEFYCMTEIGSVTSIEVLDSGQPLPAAVAFEDDGVGGSVPSRNPEALYCGEIDGQQNNFECLEGMLVSVAQGIVTRGNQRFGGDPYGPVHIGPLGERSLREPGVRFGNSVEPGVNDAAGTWDGNPEILEMDADKLGAVPAGTELVGGALFSATAVMAFSFSDYELWPTTLVIDQASNVLPRPVRERNTNAELSIGTFNVLRLCNDQDDQALYECDGQGSGPGGEPSEAEVQAKVARLAAYIIDVMQLPDVIGVQEVETQAVLEQLADAIDADAGVEYLAYLEEGNDGGGIDNGFLVRSDRIEAVSVTQLQGDRTWLDPQDGGVPSPLHDRPPLLLQAEFHTPAGGLPLRFAVLNNHAKSRSGVDNGNAAGQRNRAKRFHQGLAIAEAVRDYQDDPANAGAPLVLVGDYNDYHFSDGYVHIVGLVSGTYDNAANGCSVLLGDGTPEDCDLDGANLVVPPLLNMVDVIAAADPNEAYSYLFTENFGNIQGQARDVPTSQVLDHILVSLDIESLVVDAAYARANTDASVEGADTGSGPDGAGGTQLSLAIGSSDHDGLVAFIDTDCVGNPAADGDGDGVCDLVDNCPADPNPGQEDADSDDIGDACDDTPAVANDDAATVLEDSTANAIDVLANDSDAQGDAFEVVAVGTPASGTAGFDAQGVHYTPDADFCGSDAFDYTITGGDSATVTVTVDCVDDAPVAVDDLFVILEDAVNAVLDPLANDTDIDGGALLIDGFFAPQHGTAFSNQSTITYTPDADFCGVDSFDYELNGGSTATITVQVDCVDDAPVAVDDAVTVAPGAGAVPVDVLANDTDIDGGPMEVLAVSQGSNGAVAFTASGVTYAAADGFCGVDSFDYTITGGASATVQVTVLCEGIFGNGFED